MLAAASPVFTPLRGRLFMISRSFVKPLIACAALLAFVVPATVGLVPRTTGWVQHAKDFQHSALSDMRVQPLNAIHWQTPVDLDPPNQNGILLVHYGSALCTTANTVIVPVKTGR